MKEMLIHFQHLVKSVYHQGINCIRVLSQGTLIAIDCQRLGLELECNASPDDIQT